MLLPWRPSPTRQHNTQRTSIPVKATANNPSPQPRQTLNSRTATPQAPPPFRAPLADTRHQLASFRFWHDEKRFRGTGDDSLAQHTLLAAGGIRTGGNPKAAPNQGLMGWQMPDRFVCFGVVWCVCVCGEGEVKRCHCCQCWRLTLLHAYHDPDCVANRWDILWSTSDGAHKAAPFINPAAGQLINALPGQHVTVSVTCLLVLFGRPSAAVILCLSFVVSLT